ncbi:hypothetical protein E2C01_049945 [Portunus trituberculatus]|uniref:Uncharacterized protein n=1 Tax=Portunus trituberculatus TaxID=210409 RepID=A0A5B7GEL2_PORTR|nr:hypothetical protein [Portunus trituberculatus]
MTARGRRPRPPRRGPNRDHKDRLSGGDHLPNAILAAGSWKTGAPQRTLQKQRAFKEPSPGRTRAALHKEPVLAVCELGPP